MIVKINGSEVLIKKNTKSIQDAIEERSVASFVVVDYENTEFRKGQNVEIYDGDTLLFSGIIQKPVKKKDPSADIYYHSVTCSDWHYLADKKIVRGGYSSQTAGSIVRDLIVKYLADEGVTPGAIEDGPIVSQAQFNYVPVTDAMNALAEKAGFWWKIGADKKLYFVNRSTNKAPYVIHESDCYKGSIQSEVANDKYRNTQYVIGALDVTDPITETFTGDGENKTFTVGFPIALVPSVEVNIGGSGWVQQTVGIRGLDDNKQWYWSKGNNTVTQDQNGSPLSSADRNRIIFQGLYPVVAIVKNQSEIDTFRVDEGSTGIVEAVESVSQDNNAESAFETARQKLDRFGKISRKVKFKTIYPGLEPGQLLTVDFPKRSIHTEEMLIESVEITEEDSIVFYTVVAVSGPSMGSWAKLFYAMAQKGQDLIIRENIKENQVIVILEQFSKTWLQTETLNIFKVIRPKIGLKPGFKPMFKYSDRVRYLAWFNGATELGRKKITKQTGTDSSKIDSITFLGPNDANVAITHVGWIGGANATDAVGTGFIIDKQPYSKVKTNLEALQLVKTDVKGW